MDYQLLKRMKQDSNLIQFHIRRILNENYLQEFDNNYEAISETAKLQIIKENFAGLPYKDIIKKLAAFNEMPVDETIRNMDKIQNILSPVGRYALKMSTLMREYEVKCTKYLVNNFNIREPEVATACSQIEKALLKMNIFDRELKRIVRPLSWTLCVSYAIYCKQKGRIDLNSKAIVSGVKEWMQKISEELGKSYEFGKNAFTTPVRYKYLIIFLMIRIAGVLAAGWLWIQTGSLLLIIMIVVMSLIITFIITGTIPIWDKDISALDES